MSGGAYYVPPERRSDFLDDLAKYIELTGQRPPIAEQFGTHARFFLDIDLKDAAAPRAWIDACEAIMRAVQGALVKQMPDGAAEPDARAFLCPEDPSGMHMVFDVSVGPEQRRSLKRSVTDAVRGVIDDPAWEKIIDRNAFGAGGLRLPGTWKSIRSKARVYQAHLLITDGTASPPPDLTTRELLELGTIHCEPPLPGWRLDPTSGTRGRPRRTNAGVTSPGREIVDPVGKYLAGKFDIEEPGFRIVKVEETPTAAFAKVPKDFHWCPFKGAPHSTSNIYFMARRDTGNIKMGCYSAHCARKMSKPVKLSVRAFRMFFEDADHPKLRKANVPLDASFSAQLLAIAASESPETRADFEELLGDQ